MQKLYHASVYCKESGELKFSAFYLYCPEKGLADFIIEEGAIDASYAFILIKNIAEEKPLGEHMICTRTGINSRGLVRLHIEKNKKRLNFFQEAIETIEPL